MPSELNPIGMDGIAFVEWTAPSEEGLQSLHRLFSALGFSRLGRHRDKDVDLYRQHRIRFLVNKEREGFAAEFAGLHGPSISSMGIWVEDAAHAIAEATRRGARPYEGGPLYGGAPAIYGIGDSLVCFVEKADRPAWIAELLELEQPDRVPDRGFLVIDHLTNNVPKGTMAKWKKFYQDVFGFTEVRYFDIKGEQTGLTSHALRSACGTFCLPINEGNEDKSQIEEYLREHRGAGIQHLALLSRDLLASLDGLEAAGVATLDIDRDYYETVFGRVPNVKEDHARIEELSVLVDGDEDGYLLQIFTKNVVGPIFFEMIQRENHLSFGEGNFQALFRSIERDQERRGVL